MTTRAFRVCIFPLTVLFCLLAASSAASRLRGHLHMGWEGSLVASDAAAADEPLLVSQVLVEKGPKAAREASRVNIGNVESYAGFITVNATYNSNMFYWYFPAQSGDANAPLLIWLQGGPGGSSLFGLFTENGPFELNAELQQIPRNVTWNREYSMIYIDNPIGAGFSYTSQDAGYCTNESEVADNLYKLMSTFYLVYPQEQKNELFITGESYGGHYVPAFAYKIHQMNQEASPASVKMNLMGIAVGDGWIDPVEMIPAYPEMMMQQGLLDRKQRAVAQSYCDTTVDHIRNNNMLAAFDTWDQFLNGDIWPYHNWFHNQTGSNDYDNFLRTNAPVSFGYFAAYVNLPAVRAQIHVGNRPFQDGHECEMHLLNDFMVSMKPRLQVLLDADYKVLIYSGQLDVIIGAALTERFLPTVEWKGRDAYVNADRMVWRITDNDPDVAGFVRVAKNLQQVIIIGAGHISPHDQPARVMNMIDRLVRDIPYKNLPDPSP